MESQTTSARALRNPKIARTLCVLVLLLLVAIVFGRAAGYEFLNFDDDKFIFANTGYLPPTVQSLARLWRAPHAHLYAPMTMTAWWLIAQVATLHDAAGAISLNPWVFHTASLLVHAINVLLVWQLLRCITRADVAAMIGAALFAIHPFQVETVVWASEMKDLLAAMFSLLALIAILAASRTNNATNVRRTGLLSMSIVCFAAALLSKPSAVTLPIIAAAILWMTSAKPRFYWGVLAVGLTMALPAMLLARWAQPASAVMPPALLLRPIIAADAITFYLAKLLWPLGISVDYGRTPAAIVVSHAIAWTWVFPVIVTIVVLLSRRRMLIAAWIIFVAAPLANLGLVPFDFQAVSTVADHYVYFGMLGVSLAIACLVSTMPRVQTPLAAIIVLFAAVSFFQVGHWRDSDSLWRRAIAINPRSGLAYGNLGVVLLDRGDAAGALPLLQHAAALDPNDAFAPLNLVRANLALGDTTAAAQSAIDLETAYRQRADFNPALTAAVLDRFATAIEQRGDIASAERLRRESARLGKP